MQEKLLVLALLDGEGGEGKTGLSLRAPSSASRGAKSRGINNKLRFAGKGRLGARPLVSSNCELSLSVFCYTTSLVRRSRPASLFGAWNSSIPSGSSEPLFLRPREGGSGAPSGVSSVAFCAAWCSLYLEAEKPRPEARPKRTPSQPGWSGMEAQARRHRRPLGQATGAPPQPLLGIHAARALSPLWTRSTRPEQSARASGAVGGRVACCELGHFEHAGRPKAVRLELKRKCPRRAAGILLDAPTKE